MSREENSRKDEETSRKDLLFGGDVLRLFDGYDPADLVEHPDLLFARLLEEGDSADLRRLFAAWPEEDLARFFTDHGGRVTSRRTRRFWSLVLATESSVPPPLAREIWPL